jgi:serine protease Do
MDDAVRRAQVALVGVRAGRAPAEPEGGKEEAERKPTDPVDNGGKKKPEPKPKIPQPLPVPGQLEAVDRCSGVVLSADGLILCPLRITGWPKRERPLTVDFYRGPTLPARVLGRDERLRVALLKVEAQGLEVLEEAGPDSRQVGSFALALGFPHENPHRATPQVTLGVVSRIGALKNLHPAFDAVQTDAGVAGGNRGGPLVDIEGRLLGVLVDVNDTEGRGYHLKARGAYAGNAGLGFALPMHVVRRVREALESGATLRAAFLGVGAQPGEKGLSIVSVVEKNSKGAPTTATRAGLRAGDILVSVGGVELTGRNALREALAHRLPGEKIEIVYLRKERRHTVIVELGER